MVVKLTNCKCYTGGGQRLSAVPKRIRNGQNFIDYLPDVCRAWTDKDIKWYVDMTRGFLTSSTTKIVRDFDETAFRRQQYIKRCNRRAAKWKINGPVV